MLLFLPAVLMVAGGAVLSPALAGSTPYQNRTCVDNASGAISLNVNVVAVPGGAGPQGPQGEPGVTVLSKQEFERIRQQCSLVLAEINATLETMKNDIGQVDRKVQLLKDAATKLNATMESLDAEDAKLHSELQAFNATLQGCCPRTQTMCGIHGPWKKIKSFNTSNGDSCPPHLRTISNQGNTQRACGRASIGCPSVSIPVNTEYSQVCGIVRGYQYYTTDAFTTGTDSIDSYYVDGISITHGSPRRHLWTYANGVAEQYSYSLLRCPCARPDSLDRNGVPSFVGEHFYCESGFVDTFRHEVAWNDPLWDGAGCQSPGNQCCQRFGWFHRQVQPSSDDIELRICANDIPSNEDTLLESYEFWVI